MSRVRIIVLLAALAALATVAVACGESGEDPKKVLGDASLDGVRSGNLDFSLNVESQGAEGGKLDVSLSGPFKRRGKDFPLVDLAATVKGTANGEAIDFEGGLTLLPNRGFFNYEGVDYEIDPEYFGLAKPSFLPAAPSQGKEGGVSALSGCQEAAAGLDVNDLGDDLSNEGSAEVDGTDTTKISGDLDVAAALDALVTLAENPSCSAQLAAAGRSADELEKVRDELSDSVEGAHVEVYVGDDGIIRKIAGELTAEPQGGGQDEVEVEFELSFSEVNESPEIKAPSGGAESILVWLEGLGVSPFGAFALVSESEGLGQLLDLIVADAFPAAEG